MIRPWSFLQIDNRLFQIYDDGIDLPNFYVSNLEYDTSNNLEKYGNERNVAGKKYLRFGLAVTIKSLKNSPYSKYIFRSHLLSKEVIAIEAQNNFQVIDLTEKMSEIISQKIKIEEQVFLDLKLLYNFLVSVKIDVSKFGAEGSLLANLTNPDSDLDLVLYGESNYLNFIKILSEKNWPKEIELFRDSSFGKTTIFNARKHYSFMTEKEMIFHEARKPTGFIKLSGKMRKFSIVGILESNDVLRLKANQVFNLRHVYKSVGIGTIKGIITSDEFSLFRPSFYMINSCKLIDLSDFISEAILGDIEYIVDYLGNFYCHLQSGEKFECRATIEQLYINNVPVSKYRLNLNNWDNHIENKFYFKVILD